MADDRRDALGLSPRTRRILTLALPIVGGMVSQTILNLVDTAMVGALGAAALAAVGIASFTNFMLQALATGLSSGVQAIAARRLGEGRVKETAAPLNGGLILAIGFAVPWSILFFHLAPAILQRLIQDPEVLLIAVPYLQARVVGIVGVGMNFAFRGYWNGINRSSLYMRTLVAMHAINIVLNYILIFGKLGAPALGAVGAGIATTIATFVGSAYYLYLGFKHARKSGFLRSIPPVTEMRTITWVAGPASVQSLFFAAGFTALFYIVGLIGTDELAAANVLVNVAMTMVLPGLGLGIAAGSLVGQALGAGDAADAKRWGWDVARLTFLILALIGLPIMLFPEPILSVFLHEEATIEVARRPLILVGAITALDGIGIVLLSALQGAGDTRRPALVSVGLQWGVTLPLALFMAISGYGLLAVWVVAGATRLVQAVIFAAIWHRGRWATIKV